MSLYAHSQKSFTFVNGEGKRKGKQMDKDVVTAAERLVRAYYSGDAERLEAAVTHAGNVLMPIAHWTDPLIISLSTACCAHWGLDEDMEWKYVKQINDILFARE